MNFYLFFKSLHLIAIISWMAGLLYLPRIFVYHSESKSDEVKNTFKDYGKKIIRLHNESRYDFIVVIWFNINSFDRLAVFGEFG